MPIKLSRFTFINGAADVVRRLRYCGYFVTMYMGVCVCVHYVSTIERKPLIGMT